MPKESIKNSKEDKNPKFYSGGHWGQFYKYNGCLNKKRIKQFKKNWKFPIKTIVEECDIRYFYDMYLPKT